MSNLSTIPVDVKALKIVAYRAYHETLQETGDNENALQSAKQAMSDIAKANLKIKSPEHPNGIDVQSQQELNNIINALVNQSFNTFTVTLSLDTLAELNLTTGTALDALMNTEVPVEKFNSSTNLKFDNSGLWIQADDPVYVDPNPLPIAEINNLTIENFLDERFESPTNCTQDIHSCVNMIGARGMDLVSFDNFSQMPEIPIIDPIDPTPPIPISRPPIPPIIEEPNPEPPIPDPDPDSDPTPASLYPPQAFNDFFPTVPEDQTVTGNVIVNNGIDTDFDQDGNPLTVSLVSGPGSGSVNLTASGNFTYDPNDNYFGTDTFVYRISDGQGGTDVATVFLDFSAINDTPIFLHLDDSPVYVNNMPAVTLDTAALLVDPDLDQIGDYNGASLIVQRSGGPDTADTFGFTFTTNSTSNAIANMTGPNLLVYGSSTTIASYTDVSGILSINFLTGATPDLVDDVLQAITYFNSTFVSGTSTIRQIDYFFNDGNNTGTGLQQGIGSSLTAIGSVNLNMFSDCIQYSNLIDTNGTITNQTFNTSMEASRCDDYLHLQANWFGADVELFSNNNVSQNAFAGNDQLIIDVDITRFEAPTDVTSQAQITNNRFYQNGGLNSDIISFDLKARKIDSNTITIDGGKGKDTIDVNIEAAVIQASSTNFEFAYYAIAESNELSVLGGDGDDTINVNISATDPIVRNNNIFIDGGLGDDGIGLSLNARREGLEGDLGLFQVKSNNIEIDGGTGFNDIEIAMNAGRIENNSISITLGTREDSLQINLHATGAEGFRAESSGPSENIQSPAVGSGVSKNNLFAIDLGAGHDEFTLTMTANGSFIQNEYTILGGSGSDNLQLNLIKDIEAEQFEQNDGFVVDLGSIKQNQWIFEGGKDSDVISAVFSISADLRDNNLLLAGGTDNDFIGLELLHDDPDNYLFGDGTIINNHFVLSGGGGSEEMYLYISHTATINYLNNNTFELLGGAGDDVITLTYTQNSEGAKGEGNGQYTGALATKDNKFILSGGAGNDELYVEMFRTTAVREVFTGSGTTTVINPADHYVIEYIGGEGQDEIFIEDGFGAQHTIKFLGPQDFGDIIGGSFTTEQYELTPELNIFGTSNISLFFDSNAYDFLGDTTALGALTSNALVFKSGVPIAGEFNSHWIFDTSNSDLYYDTNTTDTINPLLVADFTSELGFDLTAQKIQLFEVPPPTTTANCTGLLISENIYNLFLLGENFTEIGETVISNLEFNFPYGVEFTLEELPPFLNIFGVNELQPNINLTGDSCDDTIHLELTAPGFLWFNQIDLSGQGANDTISLSFNAGYFSNPPEWLNEAPFPFPPILGNQIQLEGGTGSDNLSITGAFFFANNFDLTGGDGNDNIDLLWTRGTNIQNTINVNAGSGTDNIRIDLGGNNFFAITNAANTVLVDGGDDSDTINIIGGAERDGFISGRFTNGYVSVNGGSDSGDDIINFYAEIASNIVDLEGGSGNDQISLLAGGRNFSNELNINGDAGNDQITIGAARMNSSELTAEGGAGADTIIMTARSGTLNVDEETAGALANNIIQLEGNSGNDFLSLDFEANERINDNDISMIGGNGNDTINFIFGVSVIRIAPSEEYEFGFFNHGSLSTVSNNNIFLDGGTGSDLLNLDLEVFISSTEGWSNNEIRVRGGEGTDTIDLFIAESVKSAITATANNAIKLVYSNTADAGDIIQGVVEEIVFAIPGPQQQLTEDLVDFYFNSSNFDTISTLASTLSINERWVFTTTDNKLYYNKTLGGNNFITIADFTGTEIALTTSDIQFFSPI